MKKKINLEIQENDYERRNLTKTINFRVTR